MPSDDGSGSAINSQIAIVPAQAEDVPALQAVAVASWWATYGDYLSAAFIEDFLARAYATDSLLAQVADSDKCFLVAKHSDILIGFGQVGPTLPRRDAAPVAPADLYRLYLLPAWQGQGIGTHLLVALEGWLREQGHAEYGVYVHERNEAAQRFYARQGFTHKPACDIQDELYLVKALSIQL
jgi:GNAT superfamily N-acetyltransferase